MTDEECANARRAAAAIALEAERAREPALERASEEKLVALRQRQDRQAPSEQGVTDASVPAFGAPVGAVMPSLSPLFDVYADGAEPLGRRALEVENVEPPANEFAIQPELELTTELAIVPRPFRGDDAVAQ